MLKAIIGSFLIQVLIGTAAYGQDGAQFLLAEPEMSVLKDGEWQRVESSSPQVPMINRVGRLSLKDIKVVGKLIWDIVKEGEPQLDFKSERVSVLPKEVESAFELSQWLKPQGAIYKVVYKNLLGLEVVSFTYRLVFTAGGQFQGKGLYLTNVAIEPVEVNVSWGFDLDAQFEAMQIVNIGTDDEPVAALELQLRWDVDTVLQKNKNVVNFFVTGDGSWEQL